LTLAICIGECMVELRPADDRRLTQGYAGDVYNTAVYLKRSAPKTDVQFVSVTGTDPLSVAMRADWLSHAARLSGASPAAAAISGLSLAAQVVDARGAIIDSTRMPAHA
jgi:sugar/nucleoside kinase (ribokinase family)